MALHCFRCGALGPVSLEWRYGLGAQAVRSSAFDAWTVQALEASTWDRHGVVTGPRKGQECGFLTVA